MLFEIEASNPFIWIWLGVLIFSFIFEFVTAEVVSIWFVFGSLVSLILALCGIEECIQLIVFAVVSFAFMLAARPFVKKWMKRNDTKTNVDALQGRTAIVLEDILVGERGRVKIDGIEWSAVANEDIEKGKKVTILTIEGNKLVVKEIKSEDIKVNFE